MIQTIDSQHEGPNLVIMAGVHGDEPCGLQAFAEVLPNLTIHRGRVSFVLGNPKALSVHQRAYEANLNRMFRTDNELSTAEKRTYEYRRSRELMPILDSADALLDIHSSSTPDTVPFVICESHSYDCAAQLPVDVVVCGIDALHPTGTDAYVNQKGSQGICIECGNHNDPAGVSVAVTAIMRFLAFFEMLESKQRSLPRQNEQQRIRADTIYRNKRAFRLARSFCEFEAIKQGEVIGIDGESEVVAPYDGVILFPQDCAQSDQEAFLFGKEE